MLNIKDTTRRAALITAGYLVGGIVVAIAVGSGIDALLSGHWFFVGRGMAAVGTLTAFALSARLWGRRMSELTGIGPSGRAGTSTAFFVGIPLIAMGAGLAPLEPIAVRVASGHGLPIHAAYLGLFVPATLIVAAIGSFGLGRGLLDNQLGFRLALTAAPVAAVSFLLAAGFMYAIGWRIGEPGAGRRATMLVVTAVSTAAAALAAGATIGHALSPTNLSTTRPSRDAEYHVLSFEERTEAEAFIAALSRLLVSPAGQEALGDSQSVEVWGSMQKTGETLFLSDAALRVASSAFSPVPVVRHVRGAEIPRNVGLIMTSFTAKPWGVDDVAKHTLVI